MATALNDRLGRYALSMVGRGAATSRAFRLKSVVCTHRYVRSALSRGSRATMAVAVLALGLPLGACGRDSKAPADVRGTGTPARQGPGQPGGDLPAPFPGSSVTGEARNRQVPSGRAEPDSIPRRPVVSSALRSVGYDQASSTLEIEFTSGAVYRYASVPAVEYDALMSAASKGRHFNARIRNAGYSYVRVR